ncbi:MAG TPA: methyltransferase domain-containing protein [Vicinamibacterales bacterium]|nr:methyltransferase domain-containing protein [Vicinamibacterales bacterium]
MTPRSPRLSYPAILAACVLTAFAGASAAQLGSRPVDEWIKLLEAPDRIAGLKIDEVIGALDVKPGQVVADLGAGSGVFTIPLARAVGSGGKVYAVEIDQDFLDLIARKARDQQVSNIVTVLGKPRDPALPAPDVDLAFLHDVMHHIEDRPGYLEQLARYIKPRGRIAVVEFNPDTSPHRDDPRMHVTKESLRAWMSAAGFELAQQFDHFQDKWFVVYSKK